MVAWSGRALRWVAGWPAAAAVGALVLVVGPLALVAQSQGGPSIPPPPANVLPPTGGIVPCAGPNGEIIGTINLDALAEAPPTPAPDDLEAWEQYRAENHDVPRYCDGRPVAGTFEDPADAPPDSSREGKRGADRREEAKR